MVNVQANLKKRFFKQIKFVHKIDVSKFLLGLVRLVIYLFFPNSCIIIINCFWLYYLFTGQKTTQ